MTVARLEQQLSFIMEAEGLKQIFRQTVLPADRRAENDAEHSWHLSLMAILLSEHAGADQLDLVSSSYSEQPLLSLKEDLWPPPVSAT